MIKFANILMNLFFYEIIHVNLVPSINFAKFETF